METEEIYRALQIHLDRNPIPFPATESGVEIRILKQLFTPVEARLALNLSAIPEGIETIHRRTKREMDREHLKELLERMAEKGCVQKLPGKKGPKYSKMPLVLGMYEAQVSRLTPQMERDVRAYLDGPLGRELFGPRTPQMRTVPVHKAISVEPAVATYDDIRTLVETSPGPFAAIPCICRQGRELTGSTCRQTHEERNCLMLGMAATWSVEKGIGRAVSKEEMLGFLEQADRQGLVLEPQNTRDPLFVCCCCGCCCGILTTAKKLDKPAEFFQSDFLATVDGDICQVCGTCVDRCQMEAITAKEGPPEVAEERCIGCGLCVTTCPAEAMSLRKKERRPPPPKDTVALYSQIFKERYGPCGATAALIGHLVGRKF